jgi:hypothetical protein
MLSSTCLDCYSAIAAEQSWTSNPLTEKILLAIVGALLGFVSSYSLERLKRRREPHKRISWDASIQRALIEVSRSIKSKVRFLYEGAEVTSLAHIKCTVSNTGNRVVKDHEIRFPFPEGARLLEHYVNPKPEPELGVELLADELVDGKQQCRYRIAHLEREESVVFNFVTAGGDLGDWKPRSFNQEGDVDFQRRDVSIVKEDQEHLRPFLTISLLAIAIPPILESFNFGNISGLTLLITRIALLGALLPHVRPVIRVIERLINQYLETSRGLRNETIINGRTGTVVQVGGYLTGGITFTPNDQRTEEQKGYSDNGEPKES